MDTDHTAIVIYGALRSGTTMFRLMIDAHPHLACTGEHDFLFEHLRGTNPDTASYDWEALQSDLMFQAAKLSRPCGKDGAEALADFIFQMGGVRGKRPVLMVHRCLDRVRAILPDAPIVHILRDPRDVARSGLKLNFAGHVMFGADHWIETERGWHLHGPTETSIPVHYEDLATEPERTLDRFCSFIGVPFDSAMLDYDQSTSYRKPDPSLVNQWRHKLSDLQIQQIEHRVGPLLESAGYRKSGLPALRASRFQSGLWHLQNRARIWRTMISRYGLIDPVVRGIGRRLGRARLVRSAQGRMDKITLRHLE